MLYQRILTAIPLAAFVFWIIFFQSNTVFFYFLLFVVLISGYEWARLSGVNNNSLRMIFALVVTSVTWVIPQYLADYILWLIYISALWWFSISYYLKLAKPKAANSKLKPDKLFIAFVVLPAAALAMQQIHAMNRVLTGCFMRWHWYGWRILVLILQVKSSVKINLLQILVRVKPKKGLWVQLLPHHYIPW